MFPVPAVDLFSGPGGLAEGFASLRGHRPRRPFRIALSVEMDPAAHRTLWLRAFLRKFRSEFPEEYYEYANGRLVREPDWRALYPRQWAEACDETRCLRLGTPKASSFLRNCLHEIRNAHNGHTVLMGGPPCQPYSLVGRSRTASLATYDSDQDERQWLYMEYAEALRILRPAVAVMENVRGILSARHNGEPVFPKVLEVLRNAGTTGQYHLYGLSVDAVGRPWQDGSAPEDFLVRAEDHGVPQARHRVFVVCIRSDVAVALPERAFPKLEPHGTTVRVQDIIGNMPLLRSRLSRGDSDAAWQSTVREACALVELATPTMTAMEERRYRDALRRALSSTRGTALPHGDQCGGTAIPDSCPPALRDWLYDANITRLPNNETRGHIRADIARYLYGEAFACALGRSPKSTDFPPTLAPRHANWQTGKFADRFRVQVQHRPSTTITSHISKDGHYFIHPDPRQCRSLTVREVARLQTFPDNYLFHGGRTQQYVQVGNAVPPFLAQQIAAEIGKVFQYLARKRTPTSGSNRRRQAEPKR